MLNRQVRVFVFRSQTAMDNHNYLGAIYDSRQALSLDPGNALMKSRLAWALDGQGYDRFSEKDLAGAADYFQQVLLGSPNAPVLQQNLVNAEAQIRILAQETARHKADMRKIAAQDFAQF